MSSPGAAGAGETVQQPASGGVVAPNGTATPGVGTSKIGQETDVEKRAQSDADKATTICKGC